MEKTDNSLFNEALKNFVTDFSEGGAIRHLADSGMNVYEIREALDYPVSVERIGEVVWKHYIEKGVILTEEPLASCDVWKTSYVRETGEYGRTYFRQVREKCEKPGADYIKCEFGKNRYKDPEAFEKCINMLEKSDREYVCGLPWPLTPVWHVADERMKRISYVLNR